MCQEQMDLGSQIEEMIRQGMPQKITKTATYILKKQNNSINNNNSKFCTDLNCKNRKNNNCNKMDEIEILSADIKEQLIQESDHAECKEMELYSSELNKVEKLSANGIANNNNQSGVTVSSENRDILAISTQWFRKFLKVVDTYADKIQKSHRYKVLSKSTQPAHVIAVGVLSIVLLSVWPNIVDEESALRPKEKKSGLALVAYLGAFATHFGTQIWMTFVSGLSLYFSLPRHTFGLCQQILFPKYFALNSILSISTLILFVKVIGGRWEFSTYVQVIALTLCAVIEVAVRLYLAPPLLRLMVAKHKFEKNVGSGQEIGELMQGSLVNCPHYQQIHKSFRRIHMTVAMGNLTVLVCTFLHLHYLASKISVS